MDSQTKKRNTHPTTVFPVAPDEREEPVDPGVHGVAPLLEQPRVRGALGEEAVCADGVERVGEVGGAPGGLQVRVRVREREALVQQQAEEARAQAGVVHPGEGEAARRVHHRGGGST